MPQRAFDSAELRAALAGRSQRHLGATILQSFIDSSRRAPLRVHEVVRANGDFSPFAFEKGVLLRGLEWIPAVIAASDVAIHIIEYHTQNSAVCSYNRLMRFDEVNNDSTATLGLCLYLGATPIGTKLAMRQDFLRSEMALHVLEAPMTEDLQAVAENARRGFESAGVPGDAHQIKQFVF
jgi:hypothetical protein